MHASPPAEQNPSQPRPRLRHTRETARDARQRRKRLVSYGLFIGSMVLVVNALFGENGYLATVRAENAYSAVEADLNRVRQENQVLEHQIERLKSDPTALEEAAREQLDMIKPGETLVIIKDRPVSPPPGR